MDHLRFDTGCIPEPGDTRSALVSAGVCSLRVTPVVSYQLCVLLCHHIEHGDDLLQASVLVLTKVLFVVKCPCVKSLLAVGVR